MSDTICIYHGNCADGFGAAWAVWKLHPDWEFYPGVYQEPPPNVAGRRVVMVDFSYKRDVLSKMAVEAKTLLVLDHHKTAAEDLTPPPEYVDVVFDMDRSGAGITWDYFHNTPRPALINHIEDRDLWRFKLEGTREIQAAVFSYPYEFEIWDRLMSMDTEILRQEGEAIERKHHKDVAELVKVTQRQMVIGGYEVPVANLPYTLTSDAGHLMAEGLAFAACYWDTPEGRVFSLRSHEDGVDVGEIAKQYGGGGHKHASGFRVAFKDLVPHMT